MKMKIPFQEYKAKYPGFLKPQEEIQLIFVW